MRLVLTGNRGNDAARASAASGHAPAVTEAQASRMELGYAEAARNRLRRLEAAIAQASAEDGAGALSTTGLMLEHAEVLMSLGRYAETLEEEERVLDARLQACGAEHPATIDARAARAGTLSAMGHHARAMAEQESVVAARTSALGPEHLDTLRARTQKARHLSRAGRDDDALQEESAVGEVLRRTLGIDSAETIQNDVWRGYALRRLGRKEEALLVQSSVVNARQRALGVDDPATIDAETTKRALLRDLDRHDEALAEWSAAVKARLERCGPSHPATVESRIAYAVTLAAMRRSAEAIAEYDAVIEVVTHAYGGDHERTLDVRVQKARHLYRCGRYEEALDEETALDPSLRRVFGADHPTTILNSEWRAATLARLKRLEEALAEYSRVLELRTRTFGPRNRATLRVRGERADTLADLDRHQDALVEWTEVARAHEDSLGLTSAEAVAARDRCAALFALLGRADEALTEQTRVLDARKRELGPDHPETILAHANRALSLIALERYDDALADQSHVVAAYERLLSASDGRDLELRRILAIARVRHARTQAKAKPRQRRTSTLTEREQTVLRALRWWGRPGMRFFDEPSIGALFARQIRESVRSLRDGRADEIWRAIKSGFHYDPAGWDTADAGLPPPGAVQATAATWTSAVEGTAVAARLFSVGRFGDALEYLGAAAELAERQENPTGTAVVAAAQSRCWLFLGDREKACRASRRCRDSLASEGECLATEGRLVSLLLEPSPGDPAASLDRIEEVQHYRRVFEEYDDPVGAAECLLEEALQLGTLELWQEGVIAAEAASTLASHSEDSGALPCEIDVTGIHLSMPIVTAKQLEKIIKDVRIGQPALDDPWWRWQTDAILAEALRRDGDAERARKLNLRAVQALETLRWRVGDEAQRAGWIVDRFGPWRHAFADALDQHDADAVLALMERAKASRLAHFLLARATKADADLAMPASKILQGAGPLEGADNLHAQLDAAAELRNQAFKALRRRNATLAALVDADEAASRSPLTMLRQRFGSFAFLSLLESDRQSGWWCWGDENGPRNAGTYMLDAIAQAALSKLEGAPEELAAWLWAGEGQVALDAVGRRLIPAALVGADSPRRRLVISASGRLSRLPYGALSTADGTMLLDRFDISITPSFTLLTALRQHDVEKSGVLLLVAEPEQLPGTLEQVDALEKVWPTHYRADGDKASIRSLATLSDAGALSRVRSLVIAGHGLAHPSDPMRSGVRLGDGEILSAADVLALRLPDQVEFWTCSSAAEVPVAGNEPVGLAAGCLAAGATCVVGMLWPIPDRDAPRLAVAFHERLASGEAPDRAMAETQRQLRAELPFLAWAAPIVSGLSEVVRSTR
jgi:tetratricopeptide (TPR) repeat protein